MSDGSEDVMAVNEAVAKLRREGYGNSDRPLIKDLWAVDSRPATSAMSDHGDYEPAYRHVDYRRYYDPAYAALETERMWCKTWLYACREEDLPHVGDRLPFEVGPLSFLIVRAGENSFKAFYNSCPHRGTRLCDRKESGATIRCPFHAWEWKPDGTLKLIPSYWDWADLDRADAKLRAVKVERWGGFVMINVDPEAAPLSASMTVIQSHFKDFDSENRYTAASFRRVVPANWKVSMEAFMEAYHLPAIHPEALPFSGDSQSKYDIWSAGGGHVGRTATPSAIASMSAGPEASRMNASVAFTHNLKAWRHHDAEIPELDPAGDLRAQLAQWHRDLLLKDYDVEVTAPDAIMVDSLLYYMFPNMIFWLSEMVPFVYRFLPHKSDPELSYFEARMLLRYPASDERPKAVEQVQIAIDESIFEKVPALGFTGIVLDQDMENMERVQAGCRAADTRRHHSQLGRYQEKIIQRWHELLDQYVGT
jgi:phenylpropionate dioxygenase-like ring-hydroxylating dioxygenase large terminal subunit